MVIRLLCTTILVLVVVYLYFGLEGCINGATLGRNRYFMPFQIFWEDLLWSIPGGSRRRTEYIKLLVGDSGDGCICSNKRNWEYNEIRSKNLYSECAKDVLGGNLGFWTKIVIITSFCAVVACLIVG